MKPITLNKDVLRDALDYFKRKKLDLDIRDVRGFVVKAWLNLKK